MKSDNKQNNSNEPELPRCIVLASHPRCTVYKHPYNGTDTAQKVFSWTRDWMREILIMQLLNHPNIALMLTSYGNELLDKRCIIYPLYEKIEFLYDIFTKYNTSASNEYFSAQNHDNSQNSQNTDYPASTVRSFIVDTLSALEYLHARGVIHGDISPDNIMYDRQNSRFVLIDYGFAIFDFEELHHSMLSKSPYRAPEIRFNDWKILHQKLTPAIDMWSFGMVLLKLHNRGIVRTSDFVLPTIIFLCWLFEINQKQYDNPPRENIVNAVKNNICVDCVSEFVTECFHFDPAHRITAARALKLFGIDGKRQKIEYITKDILLSTMKELLEKNKARPGLVDLLYGLIPMYDSGVELSGENKKELMKLRYVYGE